MRQENTFNIPSMFGNKPRRVWEDDLVAATRMESGRDGELERLRERVENTEKVLSRLLSELLNRRVLNLDELGDILGETIELHVPYIQGTAGEVLMRWYRDGLDSFESTCPAASAGVALARPSTTKPAQCFTCISIPRSGLLFV